MAKRLILAAAVLGLCAADDPPPGAPPTPPPALAPYLRQGQFDPGDWGWMRGRFAGATPAEQKVFYDVMSWAGACTKAGSAAVARELAAMGRPVAKPEELGSGPLACRQVMTLPQADAARSFAEFQRAAAEARPVADTFLLSVRLAETAGRPQWRTLAQQLAGRPLAEQMLRYGWTWGQGELADAPPLSPDAKAVLMARIGIATAAADDANTRWLKAMVADGWPRISQVGEGPADAAWLMVQHADADPAFQLRALRLMEPLVATGEVMPRNFAFLYDRVMLKLAGRQRYATQFTCEAGRRVPLPLEDAGAVAARRKQAGLEPMAENMERIDRMYGPCPPG